MRDLFLLRLLIAKFLYTTLLPGMCRERVPVCLGRGIVAVLGILVMILGI
jgi:hypothetical protein